MQTLDSWHECDEFTVRVHALPAARPASGLVGMKKALKKSVCRALKRPAIKASPKIGCNIVKYFTKGRGAKVLLDALFYGSYNRKKLLIEFLVFRRCVHYLPNLCH